MPILSAFGAARIISGSTQSSQPLTVSFLLVGGGGGSGGASLSTRTGGGGGGGEVLETLVQAASTGVAYDIRVGVGGTASSTTPATNGGDSSYRSGINATAKGGGKGGQAYATSNGYNGGTGGTGGGGYGAGTAGGVTSGSTGYAGGPGFVDYNGRQQGAGGGGAGGPPTLGPGVLSSYYINGGAGKTSVITGLTYGGGGAGFLGNASDGGGVLNNGIDGRGGGAGGRIGSGSTAGYTGGSGVVILKIPQQYTATFSDGVTSSVTTSAGYKIYTVTVAGASQTVTFS